MKSDNANIERLEHILNSINLIRSFVEEVKLEEFKQNIQLQSAVLYQFLIIGEAVKNTDQSLLDKYSYPWHKPRSFRNFIAHGYHNIKIERVFDAITELNELKIVVKEILNKETKD